MRKGRPIVLVAVAASVLPAVLAAGCHPDRVQRLASPEPRVPGVALPGPEPYVRVISGQPVREVPETGGAASLPPTASSSLDEVRLDVVPFDAVPLSTAALMLTRMTGVNVVVSAEAGARPVSIYLKDVSARAAIEAVCRLNDLWYREDPEMIRLLPREEYSRELAIKSNEQTRLHYLKYASARWKAAGDPPVALSDVSAEAGRRTNCLALPVGRERPHGTRRPVRCGPVGLAGRRTGGRPGRLGDRAP